MEKVTTSTTNYFFFLSFRVRTIKMKILRNSKNNDTHTQKKKKSQLLEKI